MPRFTPLHLQMLLHYHGTAEPYARNEPEHAHSIAVTEYRAELLHWGLIEPAGKAQLYRTTERGRFLVECLCAMPMPEQQVSWVMPQHPMAKPCR